MGTSVDDYRASIRTLLAPLAQREPVTRPLDRALGLALARDLAAPVSLPPFDNSQMDGFAVRSEDFGAVPEFAVVAPIPAGAVPVPLAAGQAAPIMTGAMLPDGADAVIPVERAQPPRFPEPSELSDHARVVLPVTEAGTFVRRVGSDVGVGDVVLAAGTRLGPAQLGLAAALGLTEVPVRAPVRVAVVSTGAELAVPGEPLSPGRIYDSNGALLVAALREAGIEASATAVRSDEPGELRAALADSAQSADLLVTTGGVSKGAFEATKLALADADVEFVHLAMQPGGPQGIGTVAGVPFLGFPGNPVSCWVSWEVLLRPVLAELLGAPIARPRLRLPLASPLDSPSGKLQVRRARLGDDGRVGLVGGSGSHLLGALAASNALVLVPEDVTELEAGADVEVWLL
ncbi:molybdopterin molybdotransferase MoeA [Sinomonas humi]|uniref:Molybdopterin molybdenumtransferase n=1 Tax=Sinomonas humi TaxID=1338436 RepID=A0A0B2AGG5_9MICC|nr:gephyrin-like molybdotransferase Glp [Sinomonas humi]KHL00805.1 molybdenum cofactor biosynthesis protein MoaA [Sinomonas humi]